MGTTVPDIQRWLAEAPKGVRWMLVKWDPYDSHDYAAYAADKAEYDDAAEGGDRIMEVYDLSGDIEAQLREPRAFHPPE